MVLQNMILTLFAGIIILLIYLAAVNKSLGFREILVEVLLAIFEVHFLVKTFMSRLEFMQHNIPKFEKKKIFFKKR